MDMRRRMMMRTKKSPFDMKPHYYVYRVGYKAPTIKHYSLQEAHDESHRLAAQHPGEVFEILLCVGITQTTTPQTFWMDGVNIETL